MGIIGINYTKINAERIGDTKKEIKVNTAPKITDFKIATLDGFNTKYDVAQIKFNFTSIMEPKVGKLDIEGIIIYKNEKKLTKIKENWEKNQRLDQDTEVEIINYIFKYVTPKAMYIADLLQLPSIINMPRIEKK
jgi:hypothetical protein